MARLLVNPSTGPDEASAAQYPVSPTENIRLSEVVSALSCALDITEGQPEGHAVRSCFFGMRLARAIDLSNEAQSALFYALLLKDLGCSSNAAKMCYLFGNDDQAVKEDFKTTDWRNKWHQVCYIARSTASPQRSLWQWARQFMRVAWRPEVRERTGAFGQRPRGADPERGRGRT